MSTLLEFGRDVQGYNAYAPATAADKWSATIASGTATSITVPANYSTWVAVFSYQSGTDIWVDLTGATAAVPGGSTLAKTTAELNPAARTVYAGNSISIITDDTTADVGIALYAITYT